MAMTNTALKQTDAFVDVDALNALPLAHVFRATGPARMVAEGVSVGPVQTDEGVKYLVRFDGKVAQLARTENEVLELAGPSIRRHVARIEGNRARAVAYAKRQAEVAASIAKCPGHQLRAVEIGRCLRRIVCPCGYAETVSSDG